VGASARLAAVLAGLWAGVLLCIAALAAPSAFATLVSADAGRFVARVLTHEAYATLALVSLLFALERSRSRHIAVSGSGSVFSTNIVLLMGTLFCTVAGHFALQPMMAAARDGHGPWSFGALHAVSGALFALKSLLVLLLAWRLTAR
jgi:Domain of unknown function (DUF4149)